MWVLLFACMAMILCGGCRSTGASNPKPTASGAAPPAQPADANDITQTDPCAARLHEIAGAMLMYYAVNRRLPERLAELEPLADVDVTLNFTCPLSGLPYVYVPAGLRAAGRSKAIILHDAAASHGGVRWCVLMPDTSTSTGKALEVLAMPEGVFRLYGP